MARVRFIVRDDKAHSFATSAAWNARSPGVVLFETELTPIDILRERMEDSSNPERTIGQRVQALFECATVQVALDMLPEAMEKLRVLYGYYTQYELPEMQCLVLIIDGYLVVSR